MQVHAIQNSRFAAAVSEELAPNAHLTDPDAMYEAIAQAAHIGDTRMRLAPDVGVAPTPHQRADVALSIFRLCREGREARARQLAEDFERRRAAAQDGVDLRHVGRALQEALDQSATLDIAAIDKSTASPISR